MLKQNLISFVVFCSTLAFVLGIYLAAKDWVARRGRIRSRLITADEKRITSEAKLFDYRQSRSLTRDGGYASPLISLNKLILQSGTTLGFSGLVFAALACAAVSYAIAYLAGFALFMRLLAAIACGIALPIMLLLAMRNRRHHRFEEQLPEAIDTIVRSLRAGHTISMAISTVSKHLPDPIGAEFRLTAAEMAFGLDLETAMINFYERVGQPDLSLLSLAVTIQSKTGGNLAEILSNMARVVRERMKLRMKVRALSAESRVSAYILTALPPLVFGILLIIAPGYYGDVWHGSYVKPVLGGALFWMILGHYIMARMARIRV
jgi:tight adherence protein B